LVPATIPAFALVTSKEFVDASIHPVVGNGPVDGDGNTNTCQAVALPAGVQLTWNEVSATEPATIVTAVGFGHVGNVVKLTPVAVHELGLFTEQID